MTEAEAQSIMRRDAEAEARSLRGRVAELETILAALLDAAERQAAGFPIEAERWFAVRDAARAMLPEKDESHG